MTTTLARLQTWSASTLSAACGEVKASLKALTLVAAVAVLMVAVQSGSGLTLQYVHVRILWLLPIILALTRWGVAAGVVAAIAANAATAYWFYPPGFSLESILDEDVSDARVFANVATLAILLGGILRHQSQTAARRQAEMQQLYMFSRRLVGANSAAEIYDAIQSHLASVLERRVILMRPETGTLTCIPEAVAFPPQLRSLAADVLDQEAGDRLFKDGADVKWLVRQVSPKTAAFGVIAVEIGSETEASINHIGRQIATTLADAVEALELLEIDRAIRDKSIRAEADRLREAMIGAVSHDLGTPLAAILCSATVLGTVPSVSSDERAVSLVNAIREEAERHAKDIEDLLDAGRISGNALRANRQWTDLTDVINSAIDRLRHRRAEREIRAQVPNDLPFAYVDTLLVERALVQVLDNAAKYSTPDAPISVVADADDGHVRLAISDGGSGLTEGDKAAMWRQFARGERHASATRGSGLGLWIAQAFLAANGGSIQAASVGAGCGTTVTIVLPLTAIPSCEDVAGDEGDHG